METARLNQRSGTTLNHDGTAPGRITMDYSSIPENEIQIDFDASAPVSGGPDWTMCLANWQACLRTDATRRAYLLGVEDCFRFCGTRDLRQIGRSEAGRWAGDMRARGMREATVRMRLCGLQSLVRYAQENYGLRRLAGNFAEFSKRTKPYQKSRALSTEEIGRLLMQIPQHTVTGKRDLALLSGFLILGRRNTEWRLARVCDFELRGGKMMFRWSGKGHEEELIPVPGKLWDTLTDYVAASGERGPFDYVFLDRDGGHPITDRRTLDILKRYARKAGIQGNVRIHDLRHTAARLRREAGADVEEIRRFLGHRSLATTQTYLHSLEEIEDNRAEKVAEIVQVITVT